MAITYLSGERIQGLAGAAVPASTGWTFVTGMAYTSGTGITVTGTNQNYSYYDLGTSVPCTNNMVIDYDLTRHSGDHYDHPMLNLNSQLMQHGDVHTNGDSKIMLLYWGNGNTGNSSGGAVANAQFYASGSRTELGLGNSTTGYRQPADGTTRYYRFYISKSGDDVRDIRWSAWDSDANRTAEGGTGREFDEVQGTALGSAWLTSNDLRYLIVENKNGNTANWTLSNLKIWSNVQSTGVADNLLNDLPTHTFDFTDVPAVNEKATITNVPAGTRFEETDSLKVFRRKGAGISVAGLKAYFTMNEASGDIINRASEYGSTDAIANFDLSVTGATQNVSGKYNKCVSFSGNQSAVADDSNLSDTAFMSNNNAAWTVCLWSAVEGLASGGNIEGDQAWFSTTLSGSGQNGVMCRVAATVAPPNNPALIALLLGTQGDDRESSNSDANGLESGGAGTGTGWHFHAIQYDDSTGIARHMKDNSGTWNNIFTGANLTNTTTPSHKFRLAQWGDNNNNLNGDMESVSIWNRILTAAELTSLYTSTEVGQGLAPSWVEKGTA